MLQGYFLELGDGERPCGVGLGEIVSGFAWQQVQDAVDILVGHKSHHHVQLVIGLLFQLLHGLGNAGHVVGRVADG